MNIKLLELGVEQDSQEIVCEVFGQDFLDNMVLSLDLISENVNIFKKYHIDFYSEIFERYPELFLMVSNDLEEKLKKLICELGTEYLELLQENLSLLEKLIMV